MWIETQSGDLINPESAIVIKIMRKCGGGYVVAAMMRDEQITFAEYTEKNHAQKDMEEFKNKLRRNGEKIFKFKGDVEDYNSNNAESNIGK